MTSKTILVTGCSADGIGAAIALNLARSGHHVFATARNVSRIPENLVRLPNVMVLELDITSPESIAAAAKSVADSGRKLDVLLNNAGAGYAMPTLDIDVAKARSLYETNVWGPIQTIQGFSEQLIANRGRIVNMSTCAVPMNTPWISTYISSKAALTSFSEILRLELSPFGVDVVTVMAGTIDSKFHANETPLQLPAGSHYAPIEDIINGWATGMSKPKGIPAEQFAELIAKDIIGPGKGGLVWKGPNAGALSALSNWGPQSLIDAAMSYNQGLRELTEVVKNNPAQPIRHAADAVE